MVGGMKKTRKKLLWIIPALLLLGALVFHLFMWWYVHKLANQPTVSSVLPGHMDYMQIAYGAVHCMELAEKSGIEIDPAVREELRDFVVSLRECYEEGDYIDTDCSELIKVGYLYSYFDLDCTRLQEALDEFYVKKERLFADVELPDPVKELEVNVSSSADFLKILFDTGSELLADYEVWQGLETWFNKNVVEETSKADGDLAPFYDILYLAYINGSVETLPYSYLRESALPFLEEVDREMDSYEASIWNVGSLDNAAFEAGALGYDRDYLTASRQMYEKLDSREAFGYDENAEFTMLIMSYFLRFHYLVTGSIYNDFLAEDLNAMLHEYYERYCKGRIGA